jgi:hypothetical protein
MKIVHAVTADDPTGEPWPPSSTDSWCLVRRLPHDFSLWRAIEIVQPDPPPAAAQSTLGGNRNCN